MRFPIQGEAADALVVRERRGGNRQIIVGAFGGGPRDIPGRKV
jgi:hypothetical protein